MARKSRMTTVEDMKEVNLTPLMDLTFILLITFIITFPLIEQGVAVNLPTGEGDPLEEEKSLMVSVDKAGDFYLDENKMSYDALSLEIHAAHAANPSTTILVRADEEVAYGRVVKVIQILRKAGITKMALVNQSGEDVSGNPLNDGAGN